MRTLAFFLEEPSAKAMLEGLVPRLVPPNTPVELRFVVFAGKQDLEKQLVKRLRGWILPETTFIVLRDQDAGDCREIKAKLVELCTAAGRPTALVRIACQELESFYLGDLAAVERGLELTGLVHHGKKAKYRNPDKLSSPSVELRQLTKGRYQKISGSRAIGVELSIHHNCSPSFAALVAGLRCGLGS
jgi:hypothetical protein